MILHRSFVLLLVAGAVVSAPLSFGQTAEKPAAAVAVQKFGPYEALVFDKAMLSDVRVDDKGDIYLMLQPDQVAAQITMKISMEKGAGYRKWFTGDETLVAQQNATGGRTAGVWSDRIQTSANYIEYWAGGKCFLHLKKTGQ
ncbi:MAG TPA: hypothetical protein VL357_01945 [Rariglobus sp.]|jgi:hypothetical protein|nr:hypothetical protein [Rariglobus sp.]